LAYLSHLQCSCRGPDRICDMMVSALFPAALLASRGITQYLNQHFFNTTFRGLYRANAFDMALLVPYFFVATRWSVVGAVVASEEVGINAAFGRSSDLTDGVRLRILGLLMVSGVAQILLFALFVALLVPITGVAVALQDFTLQPAAFAMRLLWETLTIGFSAVLQCALYVALRERREGPVTSHLSEIFA